MGKRYSDSYQFTIDPNNPDDLARLEALRKEIALVNKWRRKLYPKWRMAREESIDGILRVSLMGRMGKNNPFIPADQRRRYRQSVPLKLSQRIDVYVHSTRELTSLGRAKRREWEAKYEAELQEYRDRDYRERLEKLMAA